MERITDTALKDTIGQIVEANSSKTAWNRMGNKAGSLNMIFAAIPRHTGKGIITVDEEAAARLTALLPGFQITGWTIDRLARVWLLMQMDPEDKTAYLSKIENLFLAAEMNESVALYSALPVLAWPEAWIRRCAEGIRSNIGAVLEAIMLHNPYPATWLDQPAWNQLVLKAFFTEKNIDAIVGLDQRANQPLSSTLLDYARERHAASRPVDDHIWKLIGKFIDASEFATLQQSFESRRNAQTE